MANLVNVNLDKETGEIWLGKNANVPGLKDVSGFTFFQPIPILSWIIQHNVGTDNLTVQIFDIDSNVIQADNIQVIDVNTVQVDFLDPQNGKAQLLLFHNT